MADKDSRDSFNRTGQGRDRYVRLRTKDVDGAIFLKPGDTITLEDVNEADIFPEANGDVVFDPNAEGAENLVKDPAVGTAKAQDYGDVVFDPN